DLVTDLVTFLFDLVTDLVTFSTWTIAFRVVQHRYTNSAPMLHLWYQGAALFWYRFSCLFTMQYSMTFLIDAR
ncbi:hypothetical protein, partial [uncultured Prevotella sp.]|uniref:hypothetical protein n=1 Tax=uncultured Prevotella sp. TaxID=159272 RepID=UPI0026153E90